MYYILLLYNLQYWILSIHLSYLLESSITVLEIHNSNVVTLKGNNFTLQGSGEIWILTSSNGSLFIQLDF